MNQLDDAIITAVKNKLVKKKANAVKARVKFGDLTIQEAGVELKVYMDKLDTLQTLEEIEAWRKS